jgi:two-component system, chemotaxis family, sensor kinase Cph1
MVSDILEFPDQRSDLYDACEREPIHTPGSIQPHGHLVVINAKSQRVTHVSERIEQLTGWPASECIGSGFRDILGELVADVLKPLIDNASRAGGGESVRVNLDRTYDVVVHATGPEMLIEFEDVASSSETFSRTNWPAVNRIVDYLKAASNQSELCDRAAREIRSATGFARVKVYRFDPDWNGEVIAEARADHMESYLNLHFPASDIPAQARRLYALNRIRLIPNVAYEPVTIVAEEGAPSLDLTFSVLRSVSPVHIEYLRNMGVAASMSVSIMRDDRLWGLIACHHDSPLAVPYPTRSICGLIADLMGFLIASRQEQEDAHLSASIGSTQGRLLEAIVRSDNYVETLVEAGSDLADLCRADGVAIAVESEIHLAGHTPALDVVRSIISAIQDGSDSDVFETSNLSSSLPDAPADPAAAGVLSISLSRVGQQQVVWFRKEVAEEVTWAGNPDKAVHSTTNGTQTLHPRASFQRWKTLRRGHSRHWKNVEVNAADALRRTIVDVALVRAQRLARLNDRLGEANDLLVRRNRELQEFTYVASHDLQEPLRKIRSFSNLLRDEYGDVFDSTAIFYLSRMEASAAHMSVLLHNLIEYASLAETPASLRPVDLNRVVEEVERGLRIRIEDAGATLRVEELPTVRGEPRRLQRLFECLLDNAIKFADPARDLELVISTNSQQGADAATQALITVRDNGIGFDQQYARRVLQPFEQVHSRDEYGGTGIGLALVRRIAEQHGGGIAITSAVGKGTAVEIRLPVY